MLANQSAYQQERKEMSQQDAAFLSGLLQMLAALYCKAQDGDGGSKKECEVKKS